jgi:hypothetical protein
MKKGLLVVLALIMVLGLVGCSSAPAEETTSTPQPTEEATQTPEATPEPTVEPATESTSEPTPMKPSSNWELVYLVDEFGDATEDVCLRGVFSGSFSNTATPDSNLEVVVFFTPAISNEERMSSFSFRLFEYGDYVATYNDNENIMIKIKIGEEIFEDVLIGMPPNGDLYRISTLNNQSEFLFTLYDALIANEQDIKCIIEIDSSKYSFKINGDGFSEALEELNEHYGIGQ